MFSQISKVPSNSVCHNEKNINLQTIHLNVQWHVALILPKRRYGYSYIVTNIVRGK